MVAAITRLFKDDANFHYQSCYAVTRSCSLFSQNYASCVAWMESSEPAATFHGTCIQSPKIRAAWSHSCQMFGVGQLLSRGTWTSFAQVYSPGSSSYLHHQGLDFRTVYHIH